MSPTFDAGDEWSASVATALGKLIPGSVPGQGTQDCLVSDAARFVRYLAHQGLSWEPIRPPIQPSVSCLADTPIHYYCSLVESITCFVRMSKLSNLNLSSNFDLMLSDILRKKIQVGASTESLPRQSMQSTNRYG